MTNINPYLNFDGKAEEAMNFYKSVFGGELTVSTFGDYQASQDPAEQDKVMHSMLTTGTGMVLMASDTPNSMELTVGDNISVSVSGDDEALMRGWWETLTAGGSVTMPLDEAPWGGLFGMGTDRFGIHWMFSIGDAGS